MPLSTVAKRGLLITFEGIEGCGKSTQVRLAEKALLQRQIPCVVTREPGGTPLGEAIRDILLHAKDLAMTPLSEFLLFSAARHQHVTAVIHPAIEASQTVLCDRYYDASTVYQGFSRGVDLNFIHRLNQAVTDKLVPDLTFILDVPVAIGRQRILQRKTAREPDRIESYDLSFHESVRQGYLQLAESEPTRICVVDAGQPVTEVHAAIMKLLLPKLTNED